jgi:hypothetical protein
MGGGCYGHCWEELGFRVSLGVSVIGLVMALDLVRETEKSVFLKPSGKGLGQSFLTFHNYTFFLKLDYNCNNFHISNN